MDRSPQFSNTSTWGPSCKKGPPVHYFTFTLPDIANEYLDENGDRQLYSNTHHVVIDLSSTSGLDDKLVLLGSEEWTNDDNPETSSPTKAARLGRTLTPGAYIITATLTRDSWVDPDARFTLVVRVEKGVPHPSGRHQPDHTASYYLRNFESDTTDAGKILHKALDDAVEEWNRVAKDSWPYVQICKGNCSANADRRRVPVDSQPYNVCDSVACVVFADSTHHMRNTEKIVFEQPAYYRVKEGGVLKHKAAKWTDVASKHGTKDRGKIQVFALSTVLHELGHVLGLDDLYNDVNEAYDDRYSGYLMGSSGKRTSVPSTDLSYLKQVYRHHGGRPHD